MHNNPIDLLPQIYFIIQGIFTTLKYSITAICFGLIIGTCLAIFKIIKIRTLNILAHSYTSVFRGTPLLIQLTIIYFGLPQIFKIELNIFVTGVLAFSLNSGAYISEIIRAGISAVDRGQLEAAKALSIPSVLQMKDIILPQAFCKILPSLVNELINLIKESALISVIGEMDLMRRAQIISAETFTFFTPMITAATTYYFLVLLISNIAVALEKKLTL